MLAVNRTVAVAEGRQFVVYIADWTQEPAVDIERLDVDTEQSVADNS